MAWADVVLLANGDRISGTVLEVGGGLVRIETPYASVLEIPAEAVESVRFDDAQQVTAEDGTVYGDVAELSAVAPGPAPGEVAHLGDAPLPEAEAEDAPEAPRLWSGKVDAGLTLRRGNTETLDSIVGGKIERDNEWNVLTLRASAAYAEADDVLNTRRYKGEVRWQVYPRDRFYVFMLGGAEHDTGRRLDLRASVAAGVGYDVIERERSELSLDAGLEFTHERWMPFTPPERRRVRANRRAEATSGLIALAGDLTDGTVSFGPGPLRQALGLVLDIRDPVRFDRTRTEEFLTFRTAAHYEQQLFRNSTLSETLTAYANLEDIGEFRFLSELAFTTPISDALDLRIALTTEYDSNARRLGVDAWDHTLVSGLSYKF